jgi:hypothetical protein
MWRLVLSGLALAAALSAQIGTAELSGTVTDSSGASVPGAKVTIVNVDTAQTRETVSDQAGNYLITLIPPGKYNLSVEASGFRKTVRNDVVLEVNQRAKVDFAMQVGEVSETVEVTAAPPLLESQSSSIGTVISQRFVNELPLNGRNFVQLAIITPGVNGVGFSTSGTIMSGTRPDDRRPGSEIFSNGNREGANNFMYDGIDNNERLTISIVLRPAVEAVREFKVQTNLFAADQGRNSGAQVDVITKSGTNEFHGSAFEFLRNSAMDARNFFNPKGTTFPPFRFNQFGFSLGGPVLIPKLYNGKNKTFFFVDYEGYRRSSVSSLVLTVPTTAMRGGDFSQSGLFPIYDPLTLANGARQQFAENKVPASRFDPITTKLINAYPLPVNGNIVSNYLANLLQTQSWDQGDIRIDHQISSKDTFFSRYALQNTTTLAPPTFPNVTLPGLSKPVGLGNEDSFAGPSFSPTQHAVASWARTFSPRLINEVRIGFNRFRLDYTLGDTAPGDALGNQFGIPNSNTHPLQLGLPIVSPSGYAGIGQSRSLPIFRRENTFQYIDNVTFISGAHTLKAGIDVRRRQITEYQTNRGNGRFNFNPNFTNQPGVGRTGDSMASFLLGLPSLIEQDFTLAWVGFRGIETAWYVGDDWRVNRKLTLNLGLRWEYYSPYTEVANRMGNFDPGTATILIPGLDNVSPTANVSKYYGGWSPRFGFAYQVDSKTVVRGGFGLFSNSNGNGGALLRLQRTFPFGPINSTTPADTAPGPYPTVSQGFLPPPVLNVDLRKSPVGSVVGIAGEFRNAYAEQFNLSVQRELPMEMVLKVAYTGNLGRRLGTTFNLNQAVPGTGAINPRRPFFGVRPALADVTYAVSDGLSNYNALQMSVEKRMSKGLGLLFGYTYGHSIDDTGTEFGGGTGTPQDARNRRADRGNSSFDIRHRATISYLYQLPFHPKARALDMVAGGWQTNGIMTLQTGLPFTPGLATNSLNTGTGSRPNRIGTGTLPNPTINKWFDPTAFTQNSPGLYGNSGRNILFGPGRFNWDVSLFKDFPIREEMKLQLRAEMFNVTNTPQFGQPNATIGSTAAGLITSTVGNPRQVQLALRFQF